MIPYYPGSASQSNVSVHFTPSLLGLHDVGFFTTSGPGGDGRRLQFDNAPTLHTTIGRSDGQTLFYINICVAGMMGLALFFMGIEIDLKIVAKVLQRPIGPAIGFISQFVFMPLCAWGIGALFLSEDYEKLGLILLGSAPGGNLSNFWTSMFGGDVNLSVTMTMISSVCSFGMTSFWVWMLGTQFAGDRDIKIPYPMIALSLAAFIVPLLMGAYYKYRNREHANKIHAKYAKPYLMRKLGYHFNP